MSNEMFTQLPTVTTALPTDIIAAVQGGVSVQETLSQVIALSVSQIILNYPGNPNGNLAGLAFQLCWDSTDAILYICIQAGNVLTAVWVKVITLTAGTGISIVQNGNNISISSSGAGIGWFNVTANAQNMVTDNGYVANSSSLVTLTLPLVSSFGDSLYIIGQGAGGWSIAQNAGQNVNIGNSSSTVGVGGSISSTNQFDSLHLVCTLANITWTAAGAPQGNLTIV
jgi:hypothetical protein